MTDNKLTDEEIISSLEVIATTGNCDECKIRNCKWGTCNCSQITANAALNLINRQNAEIERLKGSTIVNNIMEGKRIKTEEGDIWDKDIEALNIAKKAVEKQIPKKPTGIYDENESEKGKGLYEEALIGGCPVCHQEVQLGMKYCMNCGQALDWSDEYETNI